MADKKKSTKKTVAKTDKIKPTEPIVEEALEIEGVIAEKEEPKEPDVITPVQKIDLIKAWKIAAKRDHMFTGEITDEWDNMTDMCARNVLICMGTELNHLTAFVQSELSRLKIFDGEIDGVFRADLKDAVNNYLAKNNITPNGIVGYFFWEKLLK